MKTNDIVFICDDNYCMPTAVCIQSIKNTLRCTKEVINIHVCTFGLNDSNMKLLKSLCSSTINVVLDVFDENIYKRKIGEIKQRSHVTPTALIKFELANFFNNIDSVLYLDSDIVIKSDISELLQVNIMNAYLAATYEFWNHIAFIEYSLIKKLSNEFYFNSGVMLLNLKKMREDNISEKLWFYKLNKAKSTLMDQESLNAICASTAIQLPIKWNFNPIFFQKKYIKEINRVYNTNYSTVQELEEDACIIHYVGATDKPWKYKTARKRYYWEIVYNQLFDGHELYLQEVKVIKRSVVTSLLDKIKNHGLWGTLCNMIYHFKQKIGL